MGTAAIVGGSIAAAGVSGATSLIGAGEQAGAAKSAAQLQFEEQQASLAEQQREFNVTQANEAPFISAGQGAVNQLGTYANFAPPTAAEVKATPGYEFTLGQGEEALRANEAATGNVFSGTAERAATDYAENLADTFYNSRYNQALGTYQTNLNRLQSLAGEGQTAVGTEGQLGQAAATNIGNINLATGRQAGTDIQNAAAAEASGYVGAGNAFSGAMNNLGQYAMLQNLLRNTNPYSPLPAGLSPTGYNVPDVVPPVDTSALPPSMPF